MPIADKVAAANQLNEFLRDQSWERTAPHRTCATCERWHVCARPAIAGFAALSSILQRQALGDVGPFRYGFQAESR